jgi:hypothetical protein
MRSLLRPSPLLKRNLVVEVPALAGARHGRLLLARRGLGSAGGAIAILVIVVASRMVEHGELRIEGLQHHLGGPPNAKPELLSLPETLLLGWTKPPLFRRETLT